MGELPYYAITTYLEILNATINMKDCNYPPVLRNSITMSRTLPAGIINLDYTGYDLKLLSGGESDSQSSTSDNSTPEVNIRSLPEAVPVNTTRDPDTKDYFNQSRNILHFQ